VVKDVTLKKRKARAIINSKSLPKFLGMKRHRFGLAEEHNQIGEVTGLAGHLWAADLLTIEATTYKGKGKLNYTGPTRRCHERVNSGC
jgi:ATP-dependent Lon protease